MPSVSLHFGKQSMFYGFYFLSCTIVLIEGRKNSSDKEDWMKNKKQSDTNTFIGVWGPEEHENKDCFLSSLAQTSTH